MCSFPNGDRLPKVSPKIYDFEWYRDPAGYEVYSEDESGVATPHIKGKSDDTVPTVPIKPMDEPFLFNDFIRLVYRPRVGREEILFDHEALFDGAIEFANKYGLLWHEGNRLLNWYIVAAFMADLKQSYLSGKQDAAALEFNKDFDPRNPLKRDITASALIVPKLGMLAGAGKMGIIFQPANLMAAITLQIAHYIMGDTAYRCCSWCGKPFAYGPGTGHKNTKRACSPKCKMAIHRANKRGKTNG